MKSEIFALLAQGDLCRLVFPALSSVYLVICGIQDFRRRRIHLGVSAAVAALAVIALLLQKTWRIGFQEGIREGLTEGVAAVPGAMMPGALLLLLSFAAKGTAGPGDGICYLVLGIMLGMRTTWMLLAASLMLSSVCGIVLLAVRRADRKTKMPFLTISAAVWAAVLAARCAGITW
ncbi:MAG: hypothetical protein Q4D81_09205 [Eubacteriales bacterium]|nr:hypothetical protein [Eubacteriales bacterium]